MGPDPRAHAVRAVDQIGFGDPECRRRSGVLGPSSRLRPLAKAALVAVACLGGAQIDTAVRYHQIGTAVIFPPYAILTAALLLSPPREWWLYLLASSLGNFWPHRDAGAPTSFVLLAELANYTRALVATAGIRRFGAGTATFDTFRGMVAFLLFAVVLGPLVAAFAGASAVALHQGAAHYWLAWQAWLLSNMLTGLTLLPIILVGPGASARACAPPPRDASSRRRCSCSGS